MRTGRPRSQDGQLLIGIHIYQRLIVLSNYISRVMRQVMRKLKTSIYILYSLILCSSILTSNAYSSIDLGDYEGRPIASVEVVLEGVPRNATTEAELRTLLLVAPNTSQGYSAIRIRDSIQALFDSGRISNARVEVTPVNNNRPPLRVRFFVRPQVRVGDVNFDLPANLPAGISADEIRARLNLVAPGARASEQTLRNDADLIQVYLRDRGFYRATVDYTQKIDPSGTRAAVTYHINPGEQARVSDFNIRIDGLNVARVKPAIKLQPGAAFSRTLLGEDISRIRREIIDLGYLAPQLNEEKIELDSTRNTISINLTGAVGPKVNVKVEGYEFSDRKQRELLPIKREGTIEQSAIVEGERRLRNELQEEGYFFAVVQATCSINPVPKSVAINGTAEACGQLNPTELSNRSVDILYDIDLGRRFKLTDIRITGTDRLSIDEISGKLRTQEANVLGIIPLLGYGRGYTSREMLLSDQRTITAQMRDIGYRRATVEVRQGASINGESLIITFVVNEGPLTRVAGIEVRGNKIYTESKLKEQLKRTVIDAPYSPTQARADGDQILNLYAQNGYFDTNVDVAIVDLPKKGNEEQVRLIYEVKEGEKVFINRVVINGNVQTRRESIIEAIPLREGKALRADQLTESERILYNTDAFRQVIIRTEPAGETASGFKKRDVIIDVEELKPRIMNYGFGYSTDRGPLGLFDIRHVNLFGKLHQAGVRVRASQRQQIVRLEFFDPRFHREGQARFSPLSVSLQYSRDTNVTRFFRSTIDRGRGGIVQRLNKEGEPVNILGQTVGEPTINRLGLNVETQRAIGNPQHNNLFIRYNFEDVRLFKIDSLLIAPILQPDQAIRLSRFGLSFVRDTRVNDEGRYSQFEATSGELLSLDYSLALRQLGGNISFNKFQTTYRRYHKLRSDAKTGIGGTVLAFGLNLGMSNLFNPRDRNGNQIIDIVDKTLPISERFFSGGSTTLRGFGYEEAGPRLYVRPQGTFFNTEGEQVDLGPFTVPIGGNALAVVNLEARIPLKRNFQVVPFYDGGNVFREIGDIFGREVDPNEDINLRPAWTNTIGLGFRLKTPFGPLAIDYGYLLNQQRFLDPTTGRDELNLKQGQIHLRFGQAF
jgi:outer membrane protein insertion porin family